MIANPYGCYNRPPISTHYKGLNGISPYGHFNVVDIPNVNTKDCQYSKTTTDPRCAGCRHQQLTN